jgi:hypothetical protein
MATLRPDLLVTLVPSAVSGAAALAYPPTGTGTLVVAVHGAALKARGHRLTQLVELSDDDKVLWAGALDERLLAPKTDKRKGGRELAALAFFKGPRCWEIITPGALRTSAEAPVDTIWPVVSPWLVLADHPSFGLLAAPLGTTGKEERWAHALPAAALPPAIASTSQLHLVELNHVWSFPASTPTVGEVARSARSVVQPVIRGYWRA